MVVAKPLPFVVEGNYEELELFNLLKYGKSISMSGDGIAEGAAEAAED